MSTESSRRVMRFFFRQEMKEEDLKQLIEFVDSDHLKEVDLKNQPCFDDNHLTELFNPSHTGRFHKCESIDLSNTHISTVTPLLEADLGELKKTLALASLSSFNMTLLTSCLQINGVTDLDISGNRLDAQAASLLQEQLPQRDLRKLSVGSLDASVVWQSPSLETLSLQDVSEAALSSENLPRLQELWLRHVSLVPGLGSLKTLRALSLQRCPIQGDDVSALTDLTRLDLTQPSTELTPSAIVGILHKLPVLESIGLSNCGLNGATVVDVVRNGIMGHPRISAVDISENGLGVNDGDSQQAIAQLLCLPQITRLDITNNGFQPTATEITSAIKTRADKRSEMPELTLLLFGTLVPNTYGEDFDRDFARDFPLPPEEPSTKGPPPVQRFRPEAVPSVDAAPFTPIPNWQAPAGWQC